MSKEKVAPYLETYIHGFLLCVFCQHVVDFHTVHTGCGVMTKIHLNRQNIFTYEKRLAQICQT